MELRMFDALALACKDASEERGAVMATLALACKDASEEVLSWLH